MNKKQLFHKRFPMTTPLPEMKCGDTLTDKQQKVVKRLNTMQYNRWQSRFEVAANRERLEYVDDGEKI